MTILLKNGSVFTPSGFKKTDVLVSDGRIFFEPSGIRGTKEAGRVFDCTNKIIVPGFSDVHVHLREPGFFYKESIATGTAAAAKGGYARVCPMPNLAPAPSSLENLKIELDIIKQSAKVKTVPYGTITEKQDGRSRLSHMEAMAPYVCAFSDDGKGIQTGRLMEKAMIEGKRLNKLIVAHCEDESLLFNGYIHDGRYAREHGHRGICSESEWKQAERDVKLAGKTGAAYHICHVSTKETVDIVRRAKAIGSNVTCETCPHYLILCEDDLKEEGRFKMNPPLRSAEDRAALIEGIQDGTIDLIATDHAPHSEEEKRGGLEKSLFGIVGLETSFPLLYTYLVQKDIIPLEKLINLMAVKPCERFGFEGGRIESGANADLTVIDLNSRYRIDSTTFLSKGRSTPFDGWEVNGKIVMTLVDGEIRYEE